MKFTFCLAFLLLSIQNASALSNARTADAQEIQEAINEAVSLQAIMAHKVETTPAEQRDEDFKTELIKLSKERKAAYEKAIWLTIRAYDILPFRYGQPALPGGKTSLPSPEKLKHKDIAWVPVFEDKQMYRIQDETGKVMVVATVNKDDVANTASDGVSRIWPEAFLSPVELASFLIHEKLHFEQFTDPRRAGKTTGQMEVEAYKAQLRLLDEGPLVFNADEESRHRASVNEMLFYKKKQVALEKEQLARGEKLKEASILSHTAVEIDDLITQARLQVQIANRDHDERLQRSLHDLAQRSCDDAGTVTQDELDELPTPYGILGSPADPDLAAECVKVYDYLLGGGRDAETLRRLSYQPPAAPVPVEARPYKPPVTAVPLNITTPFAGSIPSLRGVAVAACATDALLPLNENLTAPRYPYSFNPAYDEQVYQQQAAGLDACSAALFRRLFEVISRREGRIDAKWVHDSAAVYRAAAAPPPPPPTYYDPCRANGNKYCP